MDIQIKLDKNTTFTPFDMTLRIETMEQLLNLYQRMSSDAIDEIPETVDKTRTNGSMSCYKIWNELRARIIIEENKFNKNGNSI